MSNRGTFMCVGEYRRAGEFAWRRLYGYVYDRPEGGYQIDFNAQEFRAGDEVHLYDPTEICLGARERAHG